MFARSIDFRAGVRTAAALAGIAFCLGGCAAMSRQYAIAVHNGGKSELHDAVVQVGDLEYNNGWLVARASKIRLTHLRRLPDSAVLKWRRPGGDWKERRLQIGKCPYRTKYPTLRFTIDDTDQVTTEFFP